MSTHEVSKHQCCEKVREAGSRWPTYNPCRRSGVISRDGNWYCKQHDPDRIREEREKRQREYDEKSKKRNAARLVERAAPDILRALLMFAPFFSHPSDELGECLCHQCAANRFAKSVLTKAGLL